MCPYLPPVIPMAGYETQKIIDFPIFGQTATLETCSVFPSLSCPGLTGASSGKMVKPECVTLDCPVKPGNDREGTVRIHVLTPFAAPPIVRKILTAAPPYDHQ